jgi:geranylgeranyl transferase type-1 subunit beta
MPDLLHSYLGLATLAIYGEPGLKELDATFCFSKDAVERLKHVAWRRS